MEGIQNVKLINIPTLEFVDNGIGQCWGKGAYGADTDKGKSRIDRVCNKMKHASMLRFVHYIFEADMSTSALLELSRHQVGVDLAVKSSRYCTKQNPNDLKYIKSKNIIVDKMLDDHMQDIYDLIINNPTIANDDLKILLPQGFMYSLQLQFNAQSLQHFLLLRSDKSAHFHIREIAQKIYDEIPESHKYLFKEFING